MKTCEHKYYDTYYNSPTKHFLVKCRDCGTVFEATKKYQDEWTELYSQGYFIFKDPEIVEKMTEIFGDIVILGPCDVSYFSNDFLLFNTIGMSVYDILLKNYKLYINDPSLFPGYARFCKKHYIKQKIKYSLSEIKNLYLRLKCKPGKRCESCKYRDSTPVICMSKDVTSDIGMRYEIQAKCSGTGRYKYNPATQEDIGLFYERFYSKEFPLLFRTDHAHGHWAMLRERDEIDGIKLEFDTTGWDPLKIFMAKYHKHFQEDREYYKKLFD